MSYRPRKEKEAAPLLERNSSTFALGCRWIFQRRLEDGPHLTASMIYDDALSESVRQLMGVMEVLDAS